LSEHTLINLLAQYGLNEGEAKIYLHLTKGGELSAGLIARAIAIRRGQTYNVLKSLQEKGVVYSLPGRPVKFAAIEPSKALNLLIEAHKQRERMMQRMKQEVISLWGETFAPAESEPQERFQFLQGIESIYARALDSLRGCKSEAMAVSPEASLYFLDRLAVVDELERLAGKGIRVRLLAEVTPKVEDALAQMKRIEVRRMPIQAIPDLLIMDGTEMIFFTKTLDSADSKDVTALWTNSETMINTMSHLFEGIWNGAAAPSEIGEPQSTVEPLREVGRPAEPLEKEIAKWLSVAGFDVSENPSVKGDSGIAHSFTLAISRDGEKRVMIDVERASAPLSPMAVIKFFAKEIDVKNNVEGTTLIVDPCFDEEARRLAKAYSIRYREIHAPAD